MFSWFWFWISLRIIWWRHCSGYYYCITNYPQTSSLKPPFYFAQFCGLSVQEELGLGKSPLGSLTPLQMVLGLPSAKAALCSHRSTVVGVPWELTEAVDRAPILAWGMRLVRLPAWWMASPTLSVPREPGPSLSSLTSGITQHCYWRTQLQVSPWDWPPLAKTF